jgi:hypothetical protein
MVEAQERVAKVATGQVEVPEALLLAAVAVVVLLRVHLLALLPEGLAVTAPSRS